MLIFSATCKESLEYPLMAALIKSDVVPIFKRAARKKLGLQITVAS